MKTLSNQEIDAGDVPNLIWVKVQDAVNLLSPTNPKLHDLRGVIASIEKYGLQELPKFDGKAGFIKAGNGRIEALAQMELEGAALPRGVAKEKSSGAWVMPLIAGVDARDLAQAQAYLIDSNNLTMSGGHFNQQDVAKMWDYQGYGKLLQELKDQGEYSVSVGEEEVDSLLKNLLRTLPSDAPVIELPEQIQNLQERWQVQRGDVWQIGKHRLICGDCTDVEVVSTLFGGQRAALCFTSPPYNVGDHQRLSGNSKMRLSKYVDSDDDLPGGEYAGLLNGFMRQSLAVSDCVCVNIQMLANNKVSVIEFWHNWREHFSDVAIWSKTRAEAAGFNFGLMNAKFEFLLFFVPAKQPGRNIPGATFRGTLDNVYVGDPLVNAEYSDIHAAAFPNHLPEWAIKNFAGPGAIYDPFCGTGTTMVVCENLGRRCLAVEKSPSYCAVTLERMSKAFPHLNIQKVS